MIALWLSAACAWAGDLPLFHAGPAEEAIERAAADAGVPPWTLDPTVPVERLSGDRPVAIGAGQPPPCVSVAISSVSLAAAASAAERKIAYQEFAAARAELEPAISQLGCLGDQAEASLLARLHYLHGISALASDDAPAATTSFERALSIQPSLPWDDAFPPDWRDPFDAAGGAAAERPTGRLLVGPGVGPALWIDGRFASAEGGAIRLQEGPHLVQVVDPTVATIEVAITADQPVAVAVPSRIPADLVARADDLPSQALVEAIVAQGWGGARPFYVFDGARTWRVAEGWELLPVSNAERELARGQARGALTAGGLTAAGLGLVAAGTGLALWLPNHEGGGATDPEGFTAATRTASAGSALFGAGVIALGVGGSGLVVGLTLGGP